MRDVFGIIFTLYMLYILFLWARAVLKSGSGRDRFHEAVGILFFGGGFGIVVFYVVFYLAGWKV